MSQHNGQPFDGAEPMESDIREIVSAAGNETMRPEEKVALWNRIEAGLVEGPRVFRLGWAVAAAVALLIAAGWWMLRPAPQGKDIMAFAKLHAAPDTLTETRLMLGNNRQLTLQGTNNTLAYSGNGTRIQVNGGEQQYEQQAEEGGRYNTLVVPYGRRAKVMLEDGTEVWLNAGSRLIYPMLFEKGRREVFLEGEAYFNVSQRQEQPFFVYTNYLKTAVLGTEFNVNAYTDEADETVVLVTGSVKVNTVTGGGGELLQPGHLAGYTVAEQHLRKENVNILAYTAWKDGRLLFERADLHHILKKLSRYFNVSITSRAAMSSTFSGDLDLSEDIASVMEAVSVSTGLTFKKTEQGYVFNN